MKSIRISDHVLTGFSLAIIIEPSSLHMFRSGGNTALSRN